MRNCVYANCSAGVFTELRTTADHGVQYQLVSIWSAARIGRELLGPRHWTSQCADHSALLFYVDLSCRIGNVALSVCQDSGVDFFGFTDYRSRGTPTALRCRCRSAICHAAHPLTGKTLRSFQVFCDVPSSVGLELKIRRYCRAGDLWWPQKSLNIIWIASQFAYDWKTMLHYIIHVYYYWPLKKPR